MDDGIRLPDEVFAHIFYFLDPKDKLNATSVCKRWLKVFNEYSDLLEEVCVCIIACSLKNILKLFSTMTRRFCYFKFKYVDIDEECFLFLERFGPQFRRLEFVNCPVHVDVDQPERKLKTCQSLLKLTVFYCGVLEIFHHLPALKSLRLEVRRFSEEDMVTMQNTIPFTLTDLRLVETLPNDADQESVVPAGVVDFIHKRRFHLEFLDLHGVNFQGYVMNRLSKMEGSSLKRLKVLSNFLPRNCIESFCNRFQGIVALDLRDTMVDYISYRRHNITPIVTDSTVVAICNSLPLLEELDIRGSTGVDESVAMIFKLKRLRKLSLFGCNGITRVSFINALKGLACRNLKMLNLRGTLIDNLTLSWLLPLVPNLREITLSNNHILNSEWIECLPRCPFCSDEVRTSVDLNEALIHPFTLLDL